MNIFLVLLFMSKYFSFGGTSVAENKCKEDLFPKPYVVLKYSKSGPEVSKLEVQGVIDLREAIASYICVNGPVIIYSSVSSHQDHLSTSPNNTKCGHDNKSPECARAHIAHLKPGETLRFINGSFKMFTHKCMYINRIPKTDLEKMKSIGMKPIIEENTIVSGIKVTGIFLITTKEPYDPGNPPFKIMFNRKAFGYKVGADEHIIKDASFVAAGRGPYCLTLKDGSRVIFNSTAQDDKAICRWTIKDDYHHGDMESKNYIHFFKKSYYRGNYSWDDCSSDPMKHKNDGNVGPIKPPVVDPNNKHDGQGEPIKQTVGDPAENKTENGTKKGPHSPSDGQDKPFAINAKPSIHPHMHVNASNRSNRTTIIANKDPKISSEEMDPPQGQKKHDAANKPRIYYIELKDCVSPPPFDPSDPLCEFIKADDYNCEKLSMALELDTGTPGNKPKKVKRTVVGSSPSSNLPTDPLTLSGNILLKWKHDVLITVGKIFSKICLPIRRQSIFQLMNVIGNYIATAHTADPESSDDYSRLVQKTNLWDTLIASLERCCQSNKTVPMQWRWSTGQVPTGQVSTGSGGKVVRKKRTKRERSFKPTSSAKNILKTLLFDEVVVPVPVEDVDEDDSEDGVKLIIQRSTSIFDFDDDDENTNEIVYGPIPKWKRETEMDKLPLPRSQEYIPPAPPPLFDTSNKFSDQPTFKSTAALDRLMKMGENKKYEDFMFHPDPSRLKIKGYGDKQIFYYEDHAQFMMDLNKVIDAFWKVLATVMGFCQMNEISRGSAVFPLLLNNFEEYFLNLIKEQWKNPVNEQEVEMVMGEFLDDDRSMWLDTCMETAFIVSDSLQYRPARPLDVDSMESDSGGEGGKTRPNSFVDAPENNPSSSGKYFTRSVKIKG